MCCDRSTHEPGYRRDHTLSAALQDRRRPAFCFQTHEALDLIREHFEGARLTTALAVYLGLTEAANRSGGAEARDGFRATRKEIAARVGLSVDTLDRYAREFEEIGLIEVERKTAGTVNLPNVWVLNDSPAPPSRTGAATPAARVRPLAGAVPLELRTEVQEELHTSADRRAAVKQAWAEAPGMVRHRDSYFDDPINYRLDKATKKYGLDDVIAAIVAYADVLSSPAHFFTHRWTLGDFLQRGLDRFVPEADPRTTFLTKRDSGKLNAQQIAEQAMEEARREAE